MVNPLRALWIIALLATFPLIAQEPVAGAEESGNEAAVEQPADTQEEAATVDKKEEEKKADEQTAEKKEETAPTTEPVVAPAVTEPAPAVAEPAPAPAADPIPTVVPEQSAVAPSAEAPKTEEVVAEVKPEDEGKQEEEKKEEEKKEEKKYNVSLMNILSHNVSKDRPVFGYVLNLAGGVTLPWELSLGASVGLAYTLQWARPDSSNVGGGIYDEDTINHYLFDGTPLNIDLSRRFTIPKAEINITPSISWALPFTSKTLWEVYTLRSMLSFGVAVDRSFKLAEGLTLTLAYNGSYTKAFAEYSGAWDDSQNDFQDFNVEHSFANMINVSLAYKGLSIKLGYGYVNERVWNNVTQTADAATYQPWVHSVMYSGGIGYGLPGFVDGDNFIFGVGFQTGGPEFEDGRMARFDYSAATSSAAEKDSQEKSLYMYPFNPRFTKIQATIGYSYSF
ncbi:MAG TPA: hypothetical protein PLV42_10270 [bacterium]|nr:hypothetical protein [bacterium]